VLVPVLPPGSADLRFALVVLDGAVFSERVLPDLLAASLVGAELFEVRLISARDPSVVLYDEAPEAGVFEAPDLDVGVGPGETQELAIAVPPGSAFETNREQVVEQMVTAGSEVPTQRWRLVARHRAGSVAAAAAALRHRQLGVAFGVLAVLAAAVALLVASARRERALAGRQLAFVAGVSHELRTPLSVLRTAGENLADGIVGDGGVRRYGALIRDESQRLTEMVETVLTYAGADAATPFRTRVNLADILNDALAQARPVLDEAGATVDVALDPDLPALDADPAALATALRNLLGNAARHGGSTVRVSARPAEIGGAPAIAIEVADDGPGFDDAEPVFEPFVRGRRAVEAQTPGSGLGLALVRRVAEAHGGTVAAATQGGAVVTLTLPAP
jgi:signal transduction histidine kinase